MYLGRSHALISGDALVSAEGRLAGPRAQATPDMKAAHTSVTKLAQLEVDTILTYHGGVVENGGEQLKSLAAELGAE